jgi:uncharacterized protein (TIGR01777 family)|tara:strand:+ start:2255 stop:3163 length:909 start_codon:yes stop_codon:yes gene_type:complete
VNNKTVLVTGATGFIGYHFCMAAVKKGYKVVALSRNAMAARERLPGVKVIARLGELPDKQSISYVLNLAGESLVSGRWNKTLKQKFINSRVDTTNELFEYFKAKRSYPDVVVSGSAVGYYGSSDDSILDETSEYREGYSHHLCSMWENAASQFQLLGSRVCYLRTGIVLGRGEGALARMVPPFKFGLGGEIGSGKQWMPWIHIADQVALIFHCMEQENISGGVNACSPNPVTNAYFTRALGEILSRPTLFSMPSIIARVIFGEMAQELLLSGQRAIPKKALETGFKFNYSSIKSALECTFHS